MKRSLFFVAALSVVLAGCGSKDDKPNTPVASTQSPSDSTTETPKSSGPTTEAPKPPLDTPTHPKGKTQLMAEAQQKALGKKAPPINVKAFPQMKVGTAKGTNAVAYAKQLDDKMRNLRNISGQAQVFVKTSTGGAGHSEDHLYIQDPSKFYIESMGLGREREGEEVITNVLIADGKNFSRKDLNGWQVPSPVGKVKSSGDVLKSWPTDFPWLMYSGLYSGRRVFSELVASASKPGSGIQATSDEKTTSKNGRSFTTKRIVLTRSAAQAKKLGRLEVEIVMSGTSSLPLTIRTTTGVVGKTPNEVMWTTYWETDPKPMPQEKFKFPFTVRA